METFAPSYESKHLQTPEEELAFLREKLMQKEKEVASLKQEKPAEIIARETIGDYKKVSSEKVLHKDYVMPEKNSDAIVLELTPEDHDEKIAELLGIMQTHGIKNALDIVEKMNDPHVQDDFERFLVQYIKSGFPIEGLSEGSPEFKALQMTLFEITLPEKTDDGKERSLKEVISSMEQFYSGMMSVDDPEGTGYFTIELAVANHSDEFTFYVAVHDSKKSLLRSRCLLFSTMRRL
jgi:hypothetical protein